VAVFLIISVTSLILISHRHRRRTVNMVPKAQMKKEFVRSTTMTEGQKKKIKQENKRKANPEKSNAKKEKSDAKRERR
jgi:hypothetical protein